MRLHAEIRRPTDQITDHHMFDKSTGDKIGVIRQVKISPAGTCMYHAVINGLTIAQRLPNYSDAREALLRHRAV